MRLALVLLLVSTLAFAKDTLEIYWIDVEGGAATLIVTPDNETILMDAGWAGYDDRDPKRIADVLENEVGKKELDYFITSHFHADHAGGVPALSKLVSIKKYVDHGDSVEIGWNERADVLWQNYLAVAKGNRMQVGPGERLRLKNTEFTFVAAGSKFLSKPIVDRGPNVACRDAAQREVDKGENGKSVGFMIRMGNFEFLDLGDLTWNYEIETACPSNVFGEIDLYQVTHHGMNMSGAPAHIAAIQPLVAVMNNGHRKGGRPETYELLTSTPSLQDLWQVHRALETDEAHNTDESQIANLVETKDCKGHWLRATVQPDGSFSIHNSRNGISKSYTAR